MGKLRDWLRGDGDRPRWSRLQYAVAACDEDLQDELQDEWNDWTPDKFTGDDSEDEFDSCSEWDDGEAVDRGWEWLGWSPTDREADGHSDGDESEDEEPLDDSTWGGCDEPRLTDDRRLQDMIDATPCVVISFLIAHGKQKAEFEREDVYQDGWDDGFARGASLGEAQEVGHSEQRAKRQCHFFKQGTCRNGDACRFEHS